MYLILIIFYFKLYDTLVGNRIDDQYTNIHHIHYIHILTHINSIDTCACQMKNVIKIHLLDNIMSKFKAILSSVYFTFIYIIVSIKIITYI